MLLPIAPLLFACAEPPLPVPPRPGTAQPAAVAPPQASPAVVLPAVPAAPPVRSGSLPPAAAPVAGPLVFEAAAPDARWISVCQARSDTNDDGRVSATFSERGVWVGDRMQRYLQFASGEEQLIDELLLSSADGRWLVLRLDQHVELYDTLTGARRDLSALGADTRTEPNEFSSHRTLAFASDSLLYVRKAEGVDAVVRHRLQDATERVLAKSADPIARLRLDPAEQSLTLSAARAENAKNGRFVWPYRLDDAPRPCRAPLARYQGPNPNADPFANAVVALDGSHAEVVDGLAAIFGSASVERDVDGALWLVRGKERRQVMDKACAGRVLFADAASDTLLLGCVIEKRPGRLNVVAVSGKQRTSLDIEVALLGDEPVRASQRLVPLYPGADCVLFDTQKQKLHRLQAGDAVLASVGGRALVRRAKSLLFFDADSGNETPLGVEVDAFVNVLVSGGLAFVSPWLIDVASGRLQGRISGKGLALSTTGAVLVPALAGTDQTLDEGPLTWRAPE